MELEDINLQENVWSLNGSHTYFHYDNGFSLRSCFLKKFPHDLFTVLEQKNAFKEFYSLTEAARIHETRNVKNCLEKYKHDPDLLHIFYSIPGKYNQPVLLETIIETAREKDNIKHSTKRGTLLHYSPSEKTKRTRCWIILHLFLNTGLSHSLNIPEALAFLRSRWDDKTWDLVIEELLCLLVTTCVKYSLVIQQSTRFSNDVQTLIEKYLGWNFPSLDFLQQEYGWLFVS